LVSRYESADESRSQRQIAEELGIPRSTLQYWLERKDSIDAEPEVVAFFESPAGTAFLHRLVLGAHFVMTLIGSCSVRQVCEFLELTGLDRFIAASYGAQQKVTVKMEESAIEFGQEEKSRLSEMMPSKDITVCQDETFHPETCLVSIEPDSNFLLLEKYAESRKASEWTKSMEEATEGLKVTIVQSTSDEGKGIVHHVKKDLGAHHAPDVFHVQHEIVKGTSAALSSKKKKTEMILEKASKEVERCIKEKEDYINGKPGPGRPPQFDKRIEVSRRKEEEARQTFETAQSHRDRMKEAIQRIGDSYHPVDLETGKLREAEEVSGALESCFSEIEAVACEAKLSESSLKRIKKAKKVVADMVATIVFFHLTIRAKIEALSLTAKVERVVLENLIPALYISRVSSKAKRAEDRHRLRQKSDELMLALRDERGPFSEFNKEELELIEKVAEECACLFQRSSSCVEGRNGQLSLRHHSLHRLSNRKLAALTVVHNYFIKRRDGTTAAERFFGAKPRDLFEYLLKKVDLPGRPARSRSLGLWPKR